MRLYAAIYTLYLSDSDLSLESVLLVGNISYNGPGIGDYTAVSTLPSSLGTLVTAES